MYVIPHNPLTNLKACACKPWELLHRLKKEKWDRFITLATISQTHCNDSIFDLFSDLAASTMPSCLRYTPHTEQRWAQCLNNNGLSWVDIRHMPSNHLQARWLLKTKCVQQSVSDERSKKIHFVTRTFKPSNYLSNQTVKCSPNKQPDSKKLDN